MLYDEAGSPVVLDWKLGEGGEGSVWRVAGRPGVCAKVYHNQLIARDNLPRVVMLRQKAQDADGQTRKVFMEYVAMPTSLLFDGRGHFVGFTMPYKDVSRAYLLVEYLSTHLMRTLRPPWDMKTRAYFLLRLFKVVSLLMDAGILPLDLGDMNIYLWGKGSDVRLFLIDADSWQVDHIPARVVAGDVAPPELFGGFKKVDEKSLVYILAIQTHRVIMDGYSPFQFVRTDDISPFEARRLGLSPLRSPGLRPPPGYPDMTRLGPLVGVLGDAISPKPSDRPAFADIHRALRMWASGVLG
jgi:DNA-binding helix-hairpin-helix protein with protein kinase domain